MELLSKFVLMLLLNPILSLQTSFRNEILFPRTVNIWAPPPPLRPRPHKWCTFNYFQVPQPLGQGTSTYGNSVCDSWYLQNVSLWGDMSSYGDTSASIQMNSNDKMKLVNMMKQAGAGAELCQAQIKLG